MLWIADEQIKWFEDGENVELEVAIVYLFEAGDLLKYILTV